MSKATSIDLETRLENLERAFAFIKGSGSRTNTKKKKDSLNDTRERFAKAYLNKKAG